MAIGYNCNALPFAVIWLITRASAAAQLDIFDKLALSIVVAAATRVNGRLPKFTTAAQASG